MSRERTRTRRSSLVVQGLLSLGLVFAAWAASKRPGNLQRGVAAPKFLRGHLRYAIPCPKQEQRPALACRLFGNDG